MKSHPRRELIFPLFCACLIASAALGQTLTIVRSGESVFSVNATAPVDSRYVLQGSPNLDLWIDINDAVSGQITTQQGVAGTKCRLFRLVAWAEPAPQINIVLLGDSTVADRVSNLGLFNGWGQGIYGYFKANARVVNLAMPGYSSKRFLTSAEKTQMVTIQPRYVFVQFGLVDEFGTETQTTTLEEFADNLRIIVGIIHDFGGTPILLTPPVRNLFDIQGKIIQVYSARRAVVKSVAAELQTHCIDLSQLSADWVDERGQAASQYIWWPDNYLHYSDLGAQVLSQLVLNACPGGLGPYLVGILDPVPKP